MSLTIGNGDHQIERRNGSYYCAICCWTWRSKPETVCPGVPRYAWPGVPPGLLSQTGLHRRKLQPGGPPRGCVMNVHDGSYWWLYDEHEAIPWTPPKVKRSEPKQRHATCAELRLLVQCYLRKLADLDSTELTERCKKQGWVVQGKGAHGELDRSWWQITSRGMAELDHWLPLLKDRMGYLNHLEQRDRRRSELLQDLYHVLIAQQHEPLNREHALQRLRRELGLEEHPEPRDQNESIIWARNLLTRDDWCILDTETTGLGGDDELVQIAVIAPNGTILLDTLLRPTVTISPGAAEVHGLTDAMLADAPTLPQVIEQIKAALDGRLIVSYNAAFDRRMLIQSRERYQLPPLGVGTEQWDCAMLHYAAFCGVWHDGYQNYRYQRLPGGDHTAAGDCLATLEVIKRMAATPLAYTEPIV